MSEQKMTELHSAFSNFTEAMRAGDTQRLRSLTTPTFTLRHMTGYVQPIDEWLSEMQAGQFVYYAIDIRDVRAELQDEHATLVVRTVTDARVYGGRNAWRLQLELSYVHEDGKWIAERADASVWR